MSVVLGPGCLARDMAAPEAVVVESKEQEFRGNHGALAGAVAEADSEDKPARAEGKKRMVAKSVMPASPGELSLSVQLTGKLANDEVLSEGLAGLGKDVPAPTAPRAWFPETFLWAPLVVTDATGHAEVSAKVPDRLTTWRVLALAHARSGAQAGTEARFLGTLPVYVDPVVPAFLVRGDEITLPIQVVNTTDAKVDRALTVSVEGALARPLRALVRLPPRGSAIESLTLRAAKPGEVRLKASLGEVDSIERTFPVIPNGRPVKMERSGTLAAPRTLAIEAPPNADKEGARAVLTVLPGALALLKNELIGSGLRGGIDHDAYSLLLAGQAPRLLASLGGELDASSLRAMKIIAMQRALRHARAPSLDVAVLLADAALSHPEDPVLARLGERLVATAVTSQRPDGTFGGQTGFTLQRLLVMTAEGVRAVGASVSTPLARNRAAGVRLRANGAFERYLGQVDDPFTAAAIVASGAVSGPIADTLLERVEKALSTREDGAKVLSVPEGVVRADGVAPSETEATALAALALLKKPAKADLAQDLGAAILGAYRPSYGWGDGRANLACLTALVQLFKQPIPEEVNITLEQDGSTIATGVLSGTSAREVMVISGEPAKASGAHAWTVRADPPVPGLGFSLSVEVYVPWTADQPRGGLELKVTVPPLIELGAKAKIEVLATAPADLAVAVEVPLPAGISADDPSLEALVDSGVAQSFHVEDGKVTVRVAPRAPGKLVSFSFLASATFVGRLHAAAPSLTPDGRDDDIVYVAPPEWNVRPRG
ncbi:MAG: hypothetical protein HYV07_15555 [Deltaproteobacteria bacterium]|nr:hypothetical protein [Deltaproteobacteria bacterium]